MIGVLNFLDFGILKKTYFFLLLHLEILFRCLHYLFDKKLLLRKVERNESGAGPIGPKVYSFPIYTWYRPDIRVRLQDQVNVDLTGYKLKIKREVLEPGFYQIGMLAIDRTSRLKLVNWVPNILHVKR